MYAQTFFYEDSREYAELCTAPAIDPATYSPRPGVELAPEYVQLRIAAAIRVEDRAVEEYLNIPDEQWEKILAGW